MKKRVVFIQNCNECPDCSIDRCSWELQGRGVVCHIPVSGVREDCPLQEVEKERNTLVLELPDWVNNIINKNLENCVEIKNGSLTKEEILKRIILDFFGGEGNRVNVETNIESWFETMEENGVLTY